MSVSLGLLSFVATVPQKFEGNASGLLGNFNGDDSDDLRYPNGTEIDINSPHRLIHDFGQSCKQKYIDTLYSGPCLIIIVVTPAPFPPAIRPYQFDFMFLRFTYSYFLLSKLQKKKKKKMAA